MHRQSVLSLIAAAAIWGYAAPSRAAERDGADKPDAAKPQVAFELRDGDRVVWLGGALIERAQKYGYWETVLTAAHPDKKVIFRNLAWSGDTVWAESRGMFDSPAVGYRRLLEHVGRIKPTVLILGYGNNESFAGEKGLPAFVKQYEKLVGDLEKVSAPGVRLVFVTPSRYFDDPDKSWVASRNETLSLYRTAIDQLAERSGGSVLDLFGWQEAQLSKHRKDLRTAMKAGLRGAARRPRILAPNGEHYSPWGYLNSISLLVQGGPHVFILPDRGAVTLPSGTKISDVTRKEGQVRFSATPAHWRVDWFFEMRSWHRGSYELRVDGVKQGQGILGQTDMAPRGLIDNKVLLIRSFHPPAPRSDDNAALPLEKLRRAIVEKNRLYFQTWRPQNITYLFGFRKHEQGQNAKEVAQIRKLVEQKEAEIDWLKKPRKQTIEIIRTGPIGGPDAD